MSIYAPMPKAAGATPPASPGQYALATLDQVRRDLSIDAADTSINVALAEDIDQATAVIETVCKGRCFIARGFRERFDRPARRTLVLRQYPIIAVTRVARGRGDALTLRCVAEGAIRASAAVFNDYSSDSSGGLRLASVAADGEKASEDLLFADCGSTSALAAAVNGVEGWTASAIVNVPTSDLLPIVAGTALVGVRLDYPSITEERYSVDQDNGRIHLLGEVDTDPHRRHGTYVGEGKFGDVLVEYEAGYAEVPDDVNKVCRELVRQAYYNRRTDPSLQTYTLGPYSVTFTRGAAEDYARGQLGHYIDRSRMI
jgi:hypothetical protein